MVQQFQTNLNGKILTIETGKIARQAHGAVTVQLGDTVVLVTVCMASPRDGIDFFPLTVEFEERLYAAGKIPGSFFKREGRPGTEGILAARMTDRSLRPLFPKGFHNEVQVISTVLSADQENPADVLAMIGASAALSISPIPFNGPISGCRVGIIGDEIIINPTYEQRSQTGLDLVIASSRDAVVMVEAGAKELTETRILEAIRKGTDVNRQIISMIEELVRACAVEKLEFPPPSGPDLVVRGRVSEIISDKLTPVIFSGKEKGERDSDLSKLRKEIVRITGEEEIPENQVIEAFEDLVIAEFRHGVLKKNIRPDGRNSDEIRPINCEVGILPRTHGSGLFTRGQTQVLSTVTLGSLSEKQKIDSLSPETTKRFFHHYNFPPYSVGEVRRIGGTGRREIGHGALAERAIEPVIPDENQFPYTVRLVSDCLSSNGSTSMGSICGSILALMDAGVPIKAPVAGIAMGLIIGDDGEYVTLTDIQGLEDHIGDMDFKVAGTLDGITALQMDVKVTGVNEEILEKALAQAREARLFVLNKMGEAISEVRKDLSPYAPRMVRILIPVEKIGAVIGPGGKTIRALTEETGATIDVESDGAVTIGSPNGESLRRAKERIESLTRDIEVGSIFTGKVTRVIPFGAFVEILPGKEGLVRLSELAEEPVQNPEDEVKAGEEITVMVIEVDRMGRINLSRRAVLDGSTPSEASSRQNEARRADNGPRPFGGSPRGGDRRPFSRQSTEGGGFYPRSGRPPERR